MFQPILTMSVSNRVYEKCQLDACAGAYGLVDVTKNGRWIFEGTVDAWRKLANDVDERSSGGYDPTCATRRSDGLHGRINNLLSKQGWIERN